MRRSEKESLRARYQFRCGYCGTEEVDAGGELTVDHFQPRLHDGSDTPGNLVYACFACNDYKGDYWAPDSPQRILHPGRDDLARHMRETGDGLLEPLTETGRFHIERIQLNRPQLVAQRRRNRELQSLRARLGRLEADHEALLQYVQAVEEQIRLLLEDADAQAER